MQDRKEYIMEKAFEVFMARGYDSVSMTVLQEKLEMSRGAMYRYFEGKDDLFIAVVDKYFFALIKRLNPRFEEGMTLLEMINVKCRNVKDICRYFDRIEKFDTVFLNYTAFVIQAAKIYPGFINKMKKFRESELKNWQQAIENSIKAKEIKENVNIKVISQVFAKAVDMSDPEKAKPGCFSKASDNTKKIMNYIYSLIKT